MKRTVDVCLAPVHDLAQFFPIGDIFELHKFDRSSGDDHAVVKAVFDVIEGLIELHEMLGRRVLRMIRSRIEKIDIYLKRRITESTKKLSLRCDLIRHEV